MKPSPHLLDVVYEAGDDLEFLISAYWKYRYDFERAVLCDNPDCHHANMDRAAATASYNSVVADLCGQIVAVIEEAI
jgi:hypothetical protein